MVMVVGEPRDTHKGIRRERKMRGVVRTTRAPRGVDRDGRLGGHELREEVHGARYDGGGSCLRRLSDEYVRGNTTFISISPPTIFSASRCRVIRSSGHSRCDYLFPIGSGVEVANRQASVARRRWTMEMDDGRSTTDVGQTQDAHACV
jgi:hypothetical protein